MPRINKRTRTYTLSTEQLVQEFVNCKRKTNSMESLLKQISVKLPLAASLEDMAFVLTDKEDITPEQKALIQINANVAASAANTDPELYHSDEFTEESYKSLACESLVSATNDMSSFWAEARDALHSVSDIVYSNIDDIDITLTALTQLDFKDKSITVCYPVDLKVLGIGEIPEGKNYLDCLISVTKDIANKADNSVVFAAGFNALIAEGLSMFGSSSITQAKTLLYKSESILTTLRKYAVEESTQSQDGLITDIALTNGYSIDTGADTFKLVKGSGKSNPNTLELVVNEEVIECLKNQSMVNRTLLTKMSNAIYTLTSDKTLVLVNSFVSKATSMLSEDNLDSTVRNTITGYCDLVRKAFTSVAEEIKFMQYVCQFSIAYNSFLIKIASEATSGELQCD